MANRHGLNRDIPDAIKRVVRQRCAFGCVVCGNGIFQYEHFKPPFADALQHSPEGITLLCGGCHDKKTRGLLSLNTVIHCNSYPKALEQGFSRGPLDMGHGISPTIILGSCRITNTPTILSVFGESLLELSAPTEENSPFLLSATLLDRNGIKFLEIDKNEWKVAKGVWDCEVAGQLLIIHSRARRIELRLRSIPPDIIIFESLEMRHRDITIRCSAELLEIERSGTKLTTAGGYISDARIAINVNNQGIGLCVGGGRLFMRETSVGPT